VGAGAVVVRSDWLVLDSMWLAPTEAFSRKVFPQMNYTKILVLYSCYAEQHVTRIKTYKVLKNLYGIDLSRGMNISVATEH
jgi:hypothetical protein